MALVKGQNSFVTVAEADSYFADRSAVSQWDSASITSKEQAVVSAWSVLEQLPWKGYTTTEDQPVAFPRVGSYYDRSRGRSIEFDSDATEAPNRVKRGQYELAFHLLRNPTILNKSSQVRSLVAGGIELEIISEASELTPSVRREIEPLVAGGFGSTLQRRN